MTDDQGSQREPDYTARARAWLEAEWDEAESPIFITPQGEENGGIHRLAALLQEVDREATERAARIADEHREQAKQRQRDLPKKRDPLYGVGSADVGGWERYQHGAGMAAAIAAAIREGAPPQEKG